MRFLGVFVFLLIALSGLTECHVRRIKREHHAKASEVKDKTAEIEKPLVPLHESKSEQHDKVRDATNEMSALNQDQMKTQEQKVPVNKVSKLAEEQVKQSDTCVKPKENEHLASYRAQTIPVRSFIYQRSDPKHSHVENEFQSKSYANDMSRYARPRDVYPYIKKLKVVFNYEPSSQHNEDQAPAASEGLLHLANLMLHNGDTNNVNEVLNDFAPIISKTSPQALMDLNDYLSSVNDQFIPVNPNAVVPFSDTELEEQCPMHKEKKHSTKDGNDDNLVQVCSCRFFKKNKETPFIY